MPEKSAPISARRGTPFRLDALGQAGADGHYLSDAVGPLSIEEHISVILSVLRAMGGTIDVFKVESRIKFADHARALNAVADVLEGAQITATPPEQPK